MWDSPQAITHPISKSYRSVYDTWVYPAIPQTHWEVVVFHDPPVGGFSWVTMAVGWLWIPPWRLSPESEVFSDRQRSSFSKAPSGQRSASVRRPFGVRSALVGGRFLGSNKAKRVDELNRLVSLATGKDDTKNLPMEESKGIPCKKRDSKEYKEFAETIDVFPQGFVWKSRHVKVQFQFFRFQMVPTKDRKKFMYPAISRGWFFPLFSLAVLRQKFHLRGWPWIFRQALAKGEWLDKSQPLVDTQAMASGGGILPGFGPAEILHMMMHLVGILPSF